MSKVKAALAVALVTSFLCLACQDEHSTRNEYPTMDDLTVLTVEGTPVQFIREKPEMPANRIYMDADGKGVLTLQDNCLRLNEDGPVIIWPHGFTPHSNNGIIEVHNAGGQTVTKVGELLEIGGGILQRDAGGCSGPIWFDTRVETEKAAPKTPSWPSPDEPSG